MKSKIVFIMILASLSVYGQDIIGQWNGLLKAGGMKLRVVLNISQKDSGYVSTMDSPDQGAKGIPVTSTTFRNGNLKIEVTNLKVEYEGSLGTDNVITGNFKQAGQTFPMNLTRDIPETPKALRPQEPVKPYPYYSEDVTFVNKKDGTVLAGTLTLPKKEGNFPAVVLITGSGPQNRDEELFGHKPFLVLSDYLTRKGIAVLRYDDRGTGASKGNFNVATTMDFASDAESALLYLKTRSEVNKKKIGLIGHSEGGMIAGIVAANSKDVAYIVSLAGPGLPGRKVLAMQMEFNSRASGKSEDIVQKGNIANEGVFDIICRSNDSLKIRTEVTEYLKKKIKECPELMQTGADEESTISTIVNQLSLPWMQSFIRYEPAKNLKKVKCPVLALGGSNDHLVPAKINLEAIKKVISKGGNNKVTVKELPGLNHLFQECKTGYLNEYSLIEQTISPNVLVEISEWIMKNI